MLPTIREKQQQHSPPFLLFRKHDWFLFIPRLAARPSLPPVATPLDPRVISHQTPATKWTSQKSELSIFFICHRVCIYNAVIINLISIIRRRERVGWDKDGDGLGTRPSGRLGPSSSPPLGVGEGFVQMTDREDERLRAECATNRSMSVIIARCCHLRAKLGSIFRFLPFVCSTSVKVSKRYRSLCFSPFHRKTENNRRNSLRRSVFNFYKYVNLFATIISYGCFFLVYWR